MAFDYKKEYKEFYLPKAQPQLVTVPPMNYIAVRGQGDPNEGRRVQGGHRPIVRRGLYHQDEQARRSPHRRVL